MTHEITNGKTKISCPESNCKKGKFKLKELEKIVDDELCQKILKFKRDKKVVLSMYQKWCPEPDCNTICKVPSKYVARKVSCPKCQREFCSKCAQNWAQHPKKGCQRIIQPSIPGNQPKEETKPCPLCRVPIQRRGGCYQMHCQFCHTKFCWFCLKKVRFHFHFRCNGRINRSLALDIWAAFWAIFFGILLAPFVLIIVPFVVPVWIFRLFRRIAPKVRKEMRILVTRLVLSF